ncbi:MAG: beta-lactamase family protein [Alteromonadaceae bacterium]|nr:beta-lactamase family protein [Alteromonadaceae bacterium]
MLKKIIIGLIAIIILVVSVAGTAIYFQIENKPSTALKVKSEKHQKTAEITKAQAEKWLTSLYNNTQIPSISAAIGVKEQLMWAGAIGYSDLKNETLADTDSLYRIGSVSKSITASALMRLNERGIIDINNSFYNYVRDFPRKSDEFTLKNLASHQAGIRHYSEGVASIFENFSDVEYTNLRDAAAIVENDDLLFSPGTNFNYSTYGYTLLSLAMEVASQRSFEDIMQKEVFDLAGMTSTFFDKQALDNINITTPYLYAEDTLLKAPEVNLSNKYAGGGYISTPSDLVKFGQALLANKLLTLETKKTLWSPIPLSNGNVNPENYAIGFRVGKDELGRYIHHGGKSVGGYTYLVIYPELEVVVAFTTNVTPMGVVFDRHKEANKLISIFGNEI